MTTLLAYLDRTADLTLPIGTTPIPGIQTYLDVSATDVHLRSQYAEAIDWCHETLSELDFVDDDDVSKDPPDMAVMAVYAYVKATRDIDARPGVGIKKTKTGAREEEYSEGVGGSYMLPAQAAWAKLEKLCDDVTMFASGGR